MSLPDLEAWAIFAKVAETGSFAARSLRAWPVRSHGVQSRAAPRGPSRGAADPSHLAPLRADRGRPRPGGASGPHPGARARPPKPRPRPVPPCRVGGSGWRHRCPSGCAISHRSCPNFWPAHPELSIDLRLDDRVVDLIADGIDIAVRIADLPDSSLLARRLCPVRRWVVGGAAYFARHGVPTQPRNLRDHACLNYAYHASGETWHFTSPAGKAESVTVKGPLTATNGDALVDALEAGLGVALLPDFLVWEAVRDQRMVTVLNEWEAPPLALHLVTPAGAPRPIRVAVLLDFLASRFTSGTAPWTIAGHPPDQGNGHKRSSGHLPDDGAPPRSGANSASGIERR